MFLIRAAFWLALVATFLPEPRAELMSLAPKLEQKANAFGAPDILAMAIDGASELTRICERNAGLCETGSAAVADLRQRAFKGARDAWRMFGAAEPALRRRQPLDGTLKPADLEPAWNAPADGRKV